MGSYTVARMHSVESAPIYNSIHCAASLKHFVIVATSNSALDS